jgi:hypothetical protein
LCEICDTLILLEFRVRKTFAADLPYGHDVANLRQKGTWASQAKINSKHK